MIWTESIRLTYIHIDLQGDMEVVIIHHHLHPGGVTRIIESQVAALSQKYPDIAVKVLVGTIPDHYIIPLSNVRLIEIPELNYLKEDPVHSQKLFDLHRSLIRQLKLNCKDASVLHIHNPNLGKNPVFTYIVYQLAQEGYSIFNHAHDLAEDRPANWQYLKEILALFTDLDINAILYPDLPNYQIGVINSFDRKRLIHSAIPGERLFLLPNPVQFFKQVDTSRKQSVRQKIMKQLSLDGQKQIITYPVRVIQRKNIGEFILLATLFSDKAHWLVTQPPKNPEEIEIYNRWKKFCSENHIPIKFEVGQHVDFEELLMASDTCFTTSIREGFGMAYLEPWLFNTPVKGRNIPYITIDLENKGIRFPFLYDSIVIKDKDFKDMPHQEQEKYIAEARMNTKFRDEVLSSNHQLISIFAPVNHDVVEFNKNTIKKEFSLNKYADELHGIYAGFIQ